MGSNVTPINIYEACKPPAMLEFQDPNYWLQKEAQTVNEKKKSLFSELRHIVEELKQRYTNDTASLRVITSVLLKAKETEAQVQVEVKNVPSLNWSYQILLFGTYVWDCRLCHLFYSLPLNQEKDASLETTLSDWEQIQDPYGLHYWAVFSSLVESYRKDLQSGVLERFNLINKYDPSHLPRIQNERKSEPEQQFVVTPSGNIVLTVCEDEVSSLIAYSLCKLSEESRKNKVASDIPEIDTSHSSNAISLLPGDSLALKGKYTITCVCAEQFYNLRKKCCQSEIMYISSLSRCKRWNAQEGKSKAIFSKTMDDRFIIKEIQKIEVDSFEKFAPLYFDYMSESIEKKDQTCLAKILGIYHIVEVRDGKETRMDLMVMENLLYGHHLSRTYDLKGTRERLAVPGSSILWDGDFIKDRTKCPIRLAQRSKQLFECAIWNDTSFLTSINVMDYSLLLGVDRENGAIVYGIIDYLRQYTVDKQFETLFKSPRGIVTKELPTVIPPKEYKKRFRQFMREWIHVVI